MDAIVVLVCLELILLCRLAVVEGGPVLTMGGDILAWVLVMLMGVISLTSLTRQMRHSFGGENRGSWYCVPHTSQILRSPDSSFIMNVKLIRTCSCSLG